MLIGIDAGCLSISDKRLKVGVYQFAVGLLKQLTLLDKKNDYVLFSFSPIDTQLVKSFGPKVANFVIKPSIGWMKIWLPIYLKSHPVDLFIGLSQNLPKLPKKTKAIVFFHDLTFERNPAWFINTYQKMSINSKYAVQNANYIVAVSENTKKDLEKIYQINSSQIKVIYEGFDPLRFSKKGERLDKFGINKPFLLFVGTFKPSKNIPNIIRAFNIFSENNPSYKLVLAGSDFWLDNEIYSEIAKSNYQKNIKVLGFISDPDLRTLYQKAALFISPSFNEGFGLTFLEASYFKVPVVTSKTGSIKEILGEGAFYADPSDPYDIALNLKKALDNPKETNKKIALAWENAKKFNWIKSAKELLKLINNNE